MLLHEEETARAEFHTKKIYLEKTKQKRSPFARLNFPALASRLSFNLKNFTLLMIALQRSMYSHSLIGFHCERNFNQMLGLKLRRLSSGDRYLLFLRSFKLENVHSFCIAWSTQEQRVMTECQRVNGNTPKWTQQDNTIVSTINLGHKIIPLSW